MVLSLHVVFASLGGEGSSIGGPKGMALNNARVYVSGKIGNGYIIREIGGIQNTGLSNKNSSFIYNDLCIDGDNIVVRGIGNEDYQYSILDEDEGEEYEGDKNRPSFIYEKSCVLWIETDDGTVECEDDGWIYRSVPANIDYNVSVSIYDSMMSSYDTEESSKTIAYQVPLCKDFD